MNLGLSGSVHIYRGKYLNSIYMNLGLSGSVLRHLAFTGRLGSFVSILPIAKIRAKDLLALLIFGCVLCLLGLAFLSVMPPKGAYLIEKMDSGVGLFLTGASLLLPVLGLRFLGSSGITR